MSRLSHWRLGHLHTSYHWSILLQISCVLGYSDFMLWSLWFCMVISLWLNNSIVGFHAESCRRFLNYDFICWFLSSMSTWYSWYSWFLRTIRKFISSGMVYSKLRTFDFLTLSCFTNFNYLRSSYFRSRYIKHLLWRHLRNMFFSRIRVFSGLISLWHISTCWQFLWLILRHGSVYVFIWFE